MPGIGKIIKDFKLSKLSDNDVLARSLPIFHGEKDITPDGNRTRAACCTPNFKFGMEGKHDNHFTTGVVRDLGESCYTYNLQTSKPPNFRNDTDFSQKRPETHHFSINIVYIKNKTRKVI